MAVSNADIQAWLAQHQGATDPQIAQAMQQYGISPDMMAQAIGADPSYIQSRFTAATAPAASGGVSNDQINNWLTQNPGASDKERAVTMQQYGVTPQQLAGAIGADPNYIQQRYDTASAGMTGGPGSLPPRLNGGNSAPWSATSGDITNWLGQHPGATDPQIAAAMQQYGITTGQMAGATGMDMAQVQQRYNAATNGAGIGSADINGWLAQHPGASDQDIATAMRQNGVSTGQLAGAIGADPNYIQTRYDAATGGTGGNGLLGGGTVTPGGGKPEGTGGGSMPGGSLVDPRETGGIGSDGLPTGPGGTGGSTGGPFVDPMRPGTGGTGGLGGSIGSGINDGGGTGTPGGLPSPIGSFGGDPYALPGYLPSPMSGFGQTPQVSMQGYQRSPYLDQIAGDITTQSNNNLQRNILPGIRSGAMAAGGLGGSRQGIAEGIAIGDSQRGLSGALGNLFGNDYQSAQGRNLQQYQGDQSYALGNRNTDLGYFNGANQFNLGVGGLQQQRYNTDTQHSIANDQTGLGYFNGTNSYNLGVGGLNNSRYGMDLNGYLTGRGQDQNFYTQQRGQDQSGALLGANLYGMGLQGPWNTLNSAAGTYSPFTGFGTSSQTGQQGGGLQGAVGGALAGGSLAGQAGWWR
jgi:hypothetical protein